MEAAKRCKESGNTVWEAKHEEAISAVLKIAPSGSGFDNGTKFDRDRSNDRKLLFTTSFHHMNEHGYYDGWTDHTITVTADLGFGYRIKVSGSNRNGIKEYIADCFAEFLDTEYEDF